MKPGCLMMVMVLVAGLILSILTPPLLRAQNAPSTQPASALDFVVADIDGNSTDLSQYKGKVVLIVNVASKCGFTKQYAGLEKLYQANKDAGLVIIGFPANNFRGQEPGSDAEIKSFCTDNFGVQFPMMSKISVKGDDIAPLYRFLTTPGTAGEFAGEITWNFNKFLIGKDGKIAGRFPSNVAPEDPKLTDAIKSALAK